MITTLKMRRRSRLTRKGQLCRRKSIRKIKLSRSLLIKLSQIGTSNRGLSSWLMELPQKSTKTMSKRNIIKSRIARIKVSTQISKCPPHLRPSLRPVPPPNDHRCHSPFGQGKRLAAYPSHLQLIVIIHLIWSCRLYLNIYIGIQWELPATVSQKNMNWPMFAPWATKSRSWVLTMERHFTHRWKYSSTARNINCGNSANCFLKRQMVFSRISKSSILQSRLLVHLWLTSKKGDILLSSTRPLGSRRKAKARISNGFFCQSKSSSSCGTRDSKSLKRVK